MSTRKSSVAVVGKVENADSAKDKDNESSSNIIDEDNKTNTASGESIASVKGETETTTRASTPIQKETSKSGGAGGNSNSSSRVTRNSPLLISPNAKKEHLGGDSEPTNSESEDGGQAKKQIRGRKSIKEAKESGAKEQSKENLSKPVEEPPIESKVKSQISSKENKDKEEEKEIQNLEENKEGKEKSVKDKTKDVEETQVKDCKEMSDTKEHEHHAKDSFDSNEKDLKDTKESKDKEIPSDPKESKDKDTKDSKETKDKDLKEAKDPKEIAAVTNRLTRNAAAQEVASKSRITRNRQSSAGSANRPETPPTARRGRVAANAARKTAENAVNQKRKRSVEESTDSPLSKVIKTEPKDISETPEEDDSSVSIALSGNTDLEGVRIKQELIESDDAASTITEVASSATAITPTFTTATGRGRGGNRWAGRKPTQTASPSTRSTRQNKVASPLTSSSPVPERKRRRTAGSNNKRGSSLSKNTGTLHTAGTNATPDEDSKDSMASSMDDILLADIKLEKLTPELEDNQDVEMETKKPFEEDVEENVETKEQTSVEPLTVKTETQVIPATKEEEEDTTTTTKSVEASTSSVASNSLNKDASLSPELVSEGVSEISVKQFYNRPNFLENNLGIEEDPKLGEIVQKVTTTDCTSKEVTVPPTVENKDTENGDNEVLEDLADIEVSDDVVAIESSNALDESFSAESIKEGDLIYEESNDGKKTPVNEQKIEKLPTTDLTSVIEIVEEKSTTKESMESSDVANVYEAKQEEDSLGERLVMAEEDLDDDDVTVEESETISMDNNPSLHDDAQEEEEDEQDVEENSQVDELLNDVTDVIVPDSESVDEITNETKQTSNECDIEKAKLEEDEEILEVEKEEIKEKENELIKIDNKSVECNRASEGKEDKKSEENVSENSQNKDKAAVQAHSTLLLTDIKSDKPDDKLIIETLKTKEIKNEETKNKSIIVTKFDSDEKEPISLTVKLAVEKNEVEKTAEIKTSCEKRRLSTTKSAELMEVDELREEEKKTEEIFKEEQQSLLKKEPTDEKMDISNSETAKDEKSSSNTSNSNSPIKLDNRYQRDSKDEDVSSIKSTQSTTDTNSWTTIEPDCDDEEKLRLKEQHLKNLGLLTHKAAEERRLEFIQTAAAVEATRAAAAAVGHHHNKRNGNKSTPLTNSSNSGLTSHEYTGTLKTVIKLNRNASGTTIANTTAITVTTASTSNGSSGRKSHITNSKDNNSGVRRQSLKMTFQKGRGRCHTAHGKDRAGNAYSSANSGDHNEHEVSYYTIQNENEGAQKISSGSSLSTATAGTKDQQSQKQHLINNNSSNVQTHGRKPYNSRSNTSNSYHHYQNHHFTTNSSHIDSSHSEGHHDGVAANALSHTSVGIISHKKDDREEILIPEKASSFKFHPGRLCEDQCYYCSGKFGLYDTPCHVGQIKSVERQQKILKNEEKLTVDNCLCDACFRHVDRRANVPSYKKRHSASGHLENINASSDGHTEDGGTSTNAETETEGARKCVVPDCGQSAQHSLRRKCIRKSVKKILLNFDMPTGSPYIWLCQSHYNAVIQCSGCVLCKRRLGKNHMYHITSDTERLEKALTDMGIPVQLGIGTAVCKLCRYFANLLMKPPDSTKSQKAEFVKNYRKRLLQFHNIHDGSNDASEADEDENNQNSSTINDADAIKGSKTTSTRRVNKDQANANSPAASSSSSVICMTENAVDHSEEVASLANVNQKSQKQSSLLESEVLMDYGMSAQNSSGETSHENSKSPISSPTVENDKQSSRLKAILQSDGKTKSTKSNKSDLPCVLLRANPNLSMRELFPGEEDLGLNFKAPFGSSNSQRTPEGWTRVQTFLQYDEPTRRLWEELQKPYGNQSSFLRHLILLEKYYRNGDLVLSANASSNASVYTQTVRQRLNSFDQGHCGGLDEVISTKSSPPPTKENTKSSDIPLVEINDDDEDENENGIERGDNSNNQESGKMVNDDDDVIMEETPSSVEKNSAKRRTRSVSVDKLTRQLSTNAVTITARPKDSTQNASTSLSKNSNLDGVQKRADLPKVQNTTSANTYNSNAGGSLTSFNSAATATITTSAAPGSIASSSSSSISSNNSNSRSILKSNLLGIANNKSVEILPIASQKSVGNANTVTATTVNIPAVSLESCNNNISGSSSSSSGSSKQQKILEVANKLRESQMEAAAAAAKQQSASILTSPPELVSLQRRSAPHSNSSGSVTNTSSTMSPTTASLINAKRPHLMPNRPTAHNRGSSSGLAPNVVILPNTLSSHERAESKSWRPTLMSVEDNQHLLNKNGPLYQTADGRRLPGLVQVQSGGKPFLISIFDYNRMCILRREKLMRDGMLNSGKHKSQQQQRHAQQSSNYSKMNNSGNSSGNSNNNSSSSSSKHAQTNAAQQQFMQMLQFQKQQQQQAAAMKAATNANNNRYHPIAPKPPSHNNNSAAANLMAGSSGNTTGNNMNLNNASNSGRLAANPANFPMPLLANALSNANAAAATATLNSNPWLWSHFPDAHELLRNGAHGGLNKLPPLLPKPTIAPNTSVANSLAPPATITSKQLQQHQQQQQQQMLLDNTLMSKIPKSLTVIPQHKLMGSSSNAATKE